MTDSFGTYNTPTATDVRSPCPAINTLANHGLINRDGKAVHKDDLKKALIENFNVDPSLANSLVSQAYGKLSKDKNHIDLSDLQQHGFIEHDVSLVHVDTAIGDNWIPQKDLVEQLVSCSHDGKVLDLQDVVNARHKRLLQCKEQNKDSLYGMKQKLLANGESAFLLDILGGGEGGNISVEHVRSFLGEERFPSDYKKPTKPVGFLKIIGTVSKIGFSSPIVPKETAEKTNATNEVSSGPAKE